MFDENYETLQWNFLLIVGAHKLCQNIIYTSYTLCVNLLYKITKAKKKNFIPCLK